MLVVYGVNIKKLLSQKCIHFDLWPDVIDIFQRENEALGKGLSN